MFSHKIVELLSKIFLAEQMLQKNKYGYATLCDNVSTLNLNFHRIKFKVNGLQPPFLWGLLFAYNLLVYHIAIKFIIKGLPLFLRKI
jgi:hypothetical protein